jgi:hypothetical protein
MKIATIIGARPQFILAAAIPSASTAKVLINTRPLHNIRFCLCEEAAADEAIS